MSKSIKIDVVSDVVCPWCALGLQALLQAIQRVGDVVQVELHFQPFELNPDIPAQGVDVFDYLQRRYGMPRQQIERGEETLRVRGEELGFHFDNAKRKNMYNTFDAHRLLHWADHAGKQLELKQALFKAYFTDGKNVSDHAQLITLAGEVGLDMAQAKAVLESDRFAKEVRERETFYRDEGVEGVPAVIINDRHLVQGAQPTAMFERMLRQFAA